MAVFPNLLASIPVTTLKSLLSKLILLLSPGLIEFIFLGLFPNTIIEVLMDRGGLLPEKMA